jgi:hypothetical protein
MGPHPPPPFDPYADGDDPRPEDVISQFFYGLESFMDSVFENPPGPIRGEWLDNQERAWRELRERLGDVGGRVAAALVSDAVHQAEERGAPRERPYLEEFIDERLDRHGLREGPLRAKMTEMRDKFRDFLHLRNTRRLSRALRTAGVITESIFDCLPKEVSGAVKEAVKGLNHLVDIAIEEGG